MEVNVIMQKNESENRQINMSKKRTATLRNDGRWQVYARVGGKRVACYGKTEYLANQKADYLEADEEVKKRLDERRGKYDFENCFYRYRNFQLFYGNIQPQSVDRYEATFDKYYKGSFFSKLDIRKISDKDICTFLTRILNKQNNFTGKEYQRIVHIFKAVINFVYDEELEQEDIPYHDWARIKRKIPKNKIITSHKREYSVSDSSKASLKEKILEDNVYPERYAQTLLLLINFSLGLRIGELAALTVGDLDFDHKVVLVHESVKRYYERDKYGNKTHQSVYEAGTTKTPRGIREIPMSESVQKMFRILLDYREQKGYLSPYLAYDGRKVRSRAASLTNTLKRMCELSDVEYFNSHIIRKTFATTLSRCPEIDVATISEYMGHAQVSTTINNYIIPAQDTVEEKIRKISGYI